MIQHLVPRVVLAVGATGLAVTYGADLIFKVDSFIEILRYRRAFGWVLGIGVAWSAYSGIKAGRTIRDEMETYVRSVMVDIEQDRRDELD